MRSITGSARDAILMMEPDGNISFWNPAAERIFGFTCNEALGRNLHDLIVPQRFQPALRSAFSAFFNSGQGPFIG